MRRGFVKSGSIELHPKLLPSCSVQYFIQLPRDCVSSTSDEQLPNLASYLEKLRLYLPTEIRKSNFKSPKSSERGLCINLNRYAPQNYRRFDP